MEKELIQKFYKYNLEKKQSEKVDQTFIIDLWSIPQNHNTLLLPKHLEESLIF